MGGAKSKSKKPKAEKSAAKDAGTAAAAEQQEGQGEEDDDIDDEMEAPKPRSSKRMAVSAGVISHEEAHDFEHEEHPKSPEQLTTLSKACHENILFAHLEEDELEKVYSAMFPVGHSAGEFVMRQGDDGDNFYVIESGVCEVWLDGKDGAEASKAVDLEAGKSFGELAIMYHAPRAASIKCQTDVKLWALEQGVYRKILMASTIKKRKQYQDMLQKVELFGPLDDHEKMAVVDALEPAKFEDGDVVMKQGDPGDYFYIIIEGTASAIIDGKEVGEMTVEKPGFFGELAIVHDAPRAATVKVKGGIMKAAKLDKERFERILGPCAELLKRQEEVYKKFVTSN
jgi:cAMP-dependent protein kinase regulator